KMTGTNPAATRLALDAQPNPLARKCVGCSSDTYVYRAGIVNSMMKPNAPIHHVAARGRSSDSAKSTRQSADSGPLNPITHFRPIASTSHAEASTPTTPTPVINVVTINDA